MPGPRACQRKGVPLRAPPAVGTDPGQRGALVHVGGADVVLELGAAGQASKHKVVVLTQKTRPLTRFPTDGFCGGYGGYSKMWGHTQKCGGCTKMSEKINVFVFIDVNHCKPLVTSCRMQNNHPTLSKIDIS